MTYPQAKLITVWECGHGHQHKTLRAAEVCIEQHTPRQPAKNNQVRDKDIVLMRLEGHTYQRISRYFGLSPGRIPQICNRELRRLRHPHCLKLFSDPEQAVAEGKVHDNAILKKLFLRKWSDQDEDIF